MGFEWDPTLYSGSARLYLEGRLPYAPGMADALAQALGLDGRGRVLDVGCGPGIVALELASLFEEVVGLDADPDMIAEAEAEARRRGIRNARWEHLRAEELPAGLGRIRVATLAQSFHWMQRERVAETIRGMLEPAGGLIHIKAYTRTGIDATASLPYPQPPWAAISELVRQYLGSETRAGQGLRDAVFSDEDDIFRSWFVGPEVVTVPDGRVLTRTTDQVVAAVYSVSSPTPHVFEDRLGAFELDLRRLLADASPARLFSQKTGDTELRIWRPAVVRASPSSSCWSSGCSAPSPRRSPSFSSSAGVTRMRPWPRLVRSSSGSIESGPSLHGARRLLTRTTKTGSGVRPLGDVPIRSANGWMLSVRTA